MNDGAAYLRAFCLSGSLNFIRYFFRQKSGRDFVVNTHHRMICAALDRVFSGEVRKLIINIAPRYGKTELAVKGFISMGLALNPSSRFIHLSYSDDLAHDNSEEIRDTVRSDTYRTLFPYVQIRRDSDSKKKWLTTAGGGVYATATGGQVTGFGAGAVDDWEDGLAKSPSGRFSGAVVIDDPIKPEDALSALKRDRVNQRFETTIRNRVNSRNTPIVIIMQRLHENDLCGYLMKIEPGQWEVLSIPCLLPGEGGEEALWPFKHTVPELHAIRDANPYVFATQYMQTPMPAEGLMYTVFKTYRTLPVTNRAVVKNYTDSADKGSDYLCSVDYLETETGNYILNVIYTQDAMQDTEPRVARMMAEDGVEVANIEGNNGGEGFARSVERQLRILGNRTTAVNTFHQSANKDTRIFSRSAEVQNMTYYPEGWEDMWPAFASSLKTFPKAGRAAHDDAEDCLTGMVEMRDENMFRSFDPDGFHPEGTALVEIHPDGGGAVVVKAYVSGDDMYIVHASSGEMPGTDELKVLCEGADVQMEVSRDTARFLAAFRRDIGSCWGREAGQPKVRRIEAYRSFIREHVLFARGLEMKAFINRMMMYDGRESVPELYAVACLAFRMKR